MSQETPDLFSDPKLRAILEKMARLPFDPHGINTDVEGISDHIESLFEEMSTEDIGELVASAVDHQLFTPEQAGEILGIATWSGRSNGAQLQPTIERWLEEARDPVRIGLALAQHTFPFSGLEQMSEVLSRVAKLHPQFAEAVDQLIARRRQQGV